jgi:hypothetical protein
MAKLYYWVFILGPLVEQENKNNLMVILHQTNLTNKVRLYTQSNSIKSNNRTKLTQKMTFKSVLKKINLHPNNVMSSFGTKTIRADPMAALQ